MVDLVRSALHCVRERFGSGSRYLIPCLPNTSEKFVFTPNIGTHEGCNVKVFLQTSGFGSLIRVRSSGAGTVVVSALSAYVREE